MDLPILFTVACLALRLSYCSNEAIPNTRVKLAILGVAKLLADARPQQTQQIVTRDNNAVLEPVIHNHTTHNDVIMGAMASQITSLTIVYTSVYSGADQRKHQSSASLAFMRGIHRLPVTSPHKWPVMRKMLPFGDVTTLRITDVKKTKQKRLIFKKGKQKKRLIFKGGGVTHRSYCKRRIHLTRCVYLFWGSKRPHAESKFSELDYPFLSHFDRNGARGR